MTEQQQTTEQAKRTGTRLGATLTLAPLGALLWALATSESATPFRIRFVNWISTHAWILWAAPLAAVTFALLRTGRVSYLRAKYSKPRPPFVVAELAMWSWLVHAWNRIFRGTPVEADEDEQSTLTDVRTPGGDGGS